MQGRRLSAYRVVSDLGTGGMGRVFRAEVEEATAGLAKGNVVALKVIHRHLLETPGFFKRFLREAEIGKHVRHDNVVRTYDCDAVQEEGVLHHFLVMEYVEGQTLRAMLGELGRVPEELCRHIGREVARGLEAIHAAGVLHRDIKPDNVLITEDHVVKIMDLGVARLQDELVRLSQTGAFVGSLAYAAPEHFRTGGRETDERADLYALGLVLYELATGAHPFRDGRVPRVLRKILEEPPRRAGEINPQLSPFFEELVHDLLSKDPADRFPHAATLVQVLEEGEAGSWWRERARTLQLETRKPLRRVRVPRETALHGRGDQLARLFELFGDVREGEGRVVLVEGEAGIGKTRLVDEFVGQLRQAGEDIHFLFGAYPPGGAATAAGAFSTAYREQFGAVGLPDALRDYLTTTPALIPAFAALLRGDAVPAGVEPLSKDSLHTVFVHVTRALAAEKPTVVLIDDLHFAPEDGRALFASIALAVRGHPILLVGTMRPGVPAAWIAEVERQEHAWLVPLARLGPKDLLTLLQDAFGSERLAHELAGQIAFKSDGNPFFAFEIIRGLREGQIIEQTDDGTWVRTDALPNVEMPSSVIDLIRARLGGLSDGERIQLEVAACCGFEFDPLLISAVLGDDAISTLQGFGRIEYEHRLVRAAGAHYVFDHHQVQEVLYQRLHVLLREQYHAAIAEALEARAGARERKPADLDGALCVDLCEHFLAGGRGASAVPYLDAALDHLESGYLSDQEIDLTEKALAVAGLLAGEARLRILFRLNVALDALGRRDRQAALIEEALALARESGDPSLRARVRSMRGALLWSTAQFERAEPEYRRALELAEEAGDRAQEGSATNGLANVLADRGRVDKARTYYERSLAIARALGDRKQEAGCLGNLGLVHDYQGRDAEAREHFDACLAITREIGDRLFEAKATGNLGYVLRRHGAQAEARALFARALKLSESIGYRQGVAKATGNLGLALSDEGRCAEATPCLERCIDISREIGMLQGEWTATADLASNLQQQGRIAEARDGYERALALCREVGERHGGSYAMIGLGQCAAAEGTWEEAERCYREGLERAHASGDGSRVAYAQVALAGLLHDRGRSEEAVPMLDEAIALAREHVRPDTEVEATCRRALLPGGDPQQAAEALSRNRERIRHIERLRGHHLLWRATHEPQHLEAAHELLAYLVEHTQEAYRESLLKNVRSHREIAEAWAAREPEPAKRVGGEHEEALRGQAHEEGAG